MDETQPLAQDLLQQYDMYESYSKKDIFVQKYKIMCLAVPGKIISIYHSEGDLCMANVSFNGVIKEICVEWLPEVKLGDYVLAHAGTAISKVDEQDAQETMKVYKEWTDSLDKKE